MAEVANAVITDDTLLADRLSSPKNLELLAKNKVLTVGDAKKLTIVDFIRMGVGEVTIDEIRTLGVRQATESKDAKIEESPNPIHIASHFAGYALQVLPGDVRRNPNGRGQAVIQPIYAVCHNGRGKLTREMWYNRKYDRDKKKVQDAVIANEPWRLDAYAWLLATKGYKAKRFRVLSD